MATKRAITTAKSPVRKEHSGGGPGDEKFSAKVSKERAPNLTGACAAALQIKSINWCKDLTKNGVGTQSQGTRRGNGAIKS